MAGSDNDDCGGVCYSLVVIFLLIVLIIFLINGDILAMADRHSGMAAWVQAIFSVIAIIGAGLFPIIHNRITENKEKKKLFRESLIVYVKHRDDFGKLNMEICNLIYKPNLFNLPDDSLDKDYYNLLMRKIKNVEITSEELFLLDSTSSTATAKLVKFNAGIKRLRMLIEREHFADETYNIPGIMETLKMFKEIYPTIKKDLLEAMKVFDALALKNNVLIKMI